MTTTRGFDERVQIRNTIVPQIADIMGTPIMLLTCQDKTGTTVTDWTRRVHPLTETPTASLGTMGGMLGRAIDYYALNGTTEYLYVADHADFSFSGAGDTAFSVFGLVYRTSAAGTLLAKYDPTSLKREWYVGYTGNAFQMILYDETATKYIMKTANAATGTSAWTFVCATYDGSAVHAGMTLYANGVAIASTGSTDGAYVMMRNGTQMVTSGAFENDVTMEDFLTGNISMIGLCSKELDADEVWSIYQRIKYMGAL